MKYWASTDEMYPVWYLEQEADDDPAWKAKSYTLIEMTDAEIAAVDVAWVAWTEAQRMISQKVIAVNKDWEWAQ